MTKEIGWDNEKGWTKKMEFIDVRRAYFHAEALRNIYIELPEEDFEEGMCGNLLKSVYGTRDAVQNWEAAYTKFMLDCGPVTGKATLCILQRTRQGHSSSNSWGRLHSIGNNWAGSGTKFKQDLKSK